jgi:sugar PTS system EIIA component
VPCDFDASVTVVTLLSPHTALTAKLSRKLRRDRGHARIVWVVSETQVQAPVAGRAVRLSDVPDPVFSAGMVGYGGAVDPPREVVDAVAPVSGKLLKLMPHAYVVMTPDNVGILVHLGLDTVALEGEGFTAHAAQGDDVTAGQKIITYDVPAIEAKGLNPIVPVVVMDERESSNVVAADSIDGGLDIAAGATLFTAKK